MGKSVFALGSSCVILCATVFAGAQGDTSREAKARQTLKNLLGD